MTEEPWPVERVRALGQLIVEKHELQRQQAGTMAKMIRGCLAAFEQTTEQAQRKLEWAKRDGNPGHYRGNVPTSMEVARKVKQDKALAFLHLQWLATQLENMSDGLTQTEEGTDHVFGHHIAS